MKKLIAILMAMVLVLCLAACGNDETVDNGTKKPGNSGNSDNADNTNTGDAPEQDSFSCTLNGVKISLHAPAAPILEALGEPISKSESPSCAFDGMDKTFVYNSFVLTTYPQGDQDYINSFWFLDDLVENDKGIAINSSLADVQAAYGSNGFDGTDTYTIVKGHGKLQIKLENEMVQDILYFATFE